MLTSQEIMNQVKMDYDCLRDMGRDVFFISAFGSVNYGTQTEKSDVDTKAVVFPNFETLVSGTKLGRTLNREGGGPGQVGIIDFRNFINSLTNGSSASWELIGTEYQYINPNYEKFFTVVFKKRERDIILLKPLYAINSIRGQFNSYYEKALEYPFHLLPNKAIAGMILMQDWLDNYFKMLDGQQLCIYIPTHKKEIIHYKTDSSVGIDESDEIRQELKKSFDKLYDEGIEKYGERGSLYNVNGILIQELEHIERDLLAYNLLNYTEDFNYTKYDNGGFFHDC